MIGECHVEHGILTSGQWPTVFKTMHTIYYVCIPGTHIYDIFVHPRTIFHVVYSSNISVLFLCAYFLSERPCNADGSTIPSQLATPAAATTGLKNKLEVTITPDYPAVMSCRYAGHGRNCMRTLFTRWVLYLRSSPKKVLLQILSQVKLMFE